MTTEYIQDPQKRKERRKERYRELQRQLVDYPDISMIDVIEEAEPDATQTKISGIYHMLKHGKLSDTRLDNIYKAGQKLIKESIKGGEND